MPDRILSAAAAATPDPERALKNLQTFCERNPEYIEQLKAKIRPVSQLFSISQFLSNFSFANPAALFESISKMHGPVEKEALRLSLENELGEIPGAPTEALMAVVRRFRKKAFLTITLRDILNLPEVSETLYELSILADVLVEASLEIVQKSIKEIYGGPEKDAFSVIAVGKLGSNELNFSSDIDIMYVYEVEQGETSGIITPNGIVTNRISNHEYYCKLGENLNKFLSANTENGFVYRVDLRLRPEGQRGSLAMSLAAYELYYESWGRAWERAVFLRARPMAGDKGLGLNFMEMIKPFVYRKYLDFNAIEEIRKMKTKIDEKFKKDDIKRGFGGIREIEFFVHALQLIYGGREPILREMSILKALHMLLQKNIIGHKDYLALSDNYMFLRKLENRLQQLNDLQTHSLPADTRELTALSRKMGFQSKGLFSSELENRRRMVRHIYASLFTEGRKDAEVDENQVSVFFDEEVSDAELKELLKDYKVRDLEKAARNIHLIRNSIHEFQTLRSRRLLGEILPVFLYEVLMSKDPDSGLNNLQSFAVLLSSEEAYLDLFATDKIFISALVRIFSQSAYLAKAVMKRTEYLEVLGHKLFTRHTLHSEKKELKEMLASKRSLADSVRALKQMEEIRLGILFLDKKIDCLNLTKGLSKVADAIVAVCCDELFREDELTVIGLGKAGGRELTFGSDLDLIFVCKGVATESRTKNAERLIRLLTSYTKDGMAYKVDARLRPDGTKGPLVLSVDAFRDYYLQAAHFWELQALLKARPVGGNRDTGCLFMDMRKDVLASKGREVSASDIINLRERIQRELSIEAREPQSYDIKLGPGGLEELEFTVQYLQLVNLHKHRRLIVQGTRDALKRLSLSGVIAKEGYDFMQESYMFYRTVESFMRLIGESVLKAGSTPAELIAEFTGFEDSSSFIGYLDERRAGVREIFEKYLKD